MPAMRIAPFALQQFDVALQYGGGSSQIKRLFLWVPPRPQAEARLRPSFPTQDRRMANDEPSWAWRATIICGSYKLRCFHKVNNGVGARAAYGQCGETCALQSRRRSIVNLRRARTCAVVWKGNVSICIFLAPG
jgi:hypothetical protein